MTNDLLLRIITSLLVIGSLYPLVYLLKEILSKPPKGSKSDAVELVLFMIYATFLLSGVITLYINILVIFFMVEQHNFTTLALIRNSLKHIGVLLVSWKLYFIMRGR